MEGEGFGGNEGEDKGEGEGEGDKDEDEDEDRGEDKDRRDPGKSLKGTKAIKIPRIAKAITEATWSPYV